MAEMPRNLALYRKVDELELERLDVDRSTCYPASRTDFEIWLCEQLNPVTSDERQFGHYLIHAARGNCPELEKTPELCHHLDDLRSSPYQWYWCPVCFEDEIPL